jgi:hypothetical protein
MNSSALKLMNTPQMSLLVFLTVICLPFSGQAESLPGGKARFTWVHGKFVTNGNSWERITNLTFTATTGTVAATVWLWQSEIKKGKTEFNSHICTMDGVSKNCDTWTPTGWVFPSGHHVSWTGTYTYDANTGVLEISWITGNPGGSERWTVTNPTSAIARSTLISSNYGTTHGRGYGSNAPWSIYKTINQMKPFPKYISGNGSVGVSMVRRTASDGAITITVNPKTSGAWIAASLNLSEFSTPSTTGIANTIHRWDQRTAVCNVSMCNPNQRPGVTGIIYHLASLNNSRAMAYQHFCACLATNSGFPSYGGNNHPWAFSQIIDDNGELAGFIGCQAQNPPGAAYKGDFMFYMVDFNNMP